MTLRIEHPVTAAADPAQTMRQLGLLPRAQIRVVTSAARAPAAAPPASPAAKTTAGVDVDGDGDDVDAVARCWLV